MKLLERTKRKIREAEQHLELLKVSQTADELEGHLATFTAMVLLIQKIGQIGRQIPVLE